MKKIILFILLLSSVTVNAQDFFGNRRVFYNATLTDSMIVDFNQSNNKSIITKLWATSNLVKIGDSNSIYWAPWKIINYVSTHTTTETDPVFVASASHGITGTNITNWNSAYTWVNSYGANSTNWNSAYSWVSSYGGNYSNWNTAYSWGNHASAGYLTPWIDIDRNGFLNQTETTISFDGTSVFTLAPVGSTWTYYRAGVKYVISGSKTVTLPGIPVTTGTYYIYIDASNGNLTASTTAWNLLDSKVPVALLSFNNALTPKYILADERHSVLIDRRAHYYWHSTRGAMLVSGGTLDGPVVSSAYSDANNCVGISQTIFNDEDIINTLNQKVKPIGTGANDYMIFYRTSPTTWAWKYSDVPFSYNSGTGYIQYDNNGTLTDAATNNRINYYLIYTNYKDTSRFVFIPGRSVYASEATAQTENPLDFNWSGFPISEGFIAYQFTYQVNVAQSNKGKTRIEVSPKKINSSYSSISNVVNVGSIYGYSYKENFTENTYSYNKTFYSLISGPSYLVTIGDSSMTVTVTGNYKIKVTGGWFSNDAGCTSIRIFKNSTQIAKTGEESSNFTNSNFGIEIIENLLVGDIIKIKYANCSGSGTIHFQDFRFIIEKLP